MQQRIDLQGLARALLRTRTTKQLGDDIGLSQAAVSRLATGKTRAIGADPAIALIRLAGGRVIVPEVEADSTQRPPRASIPHSKVRAS